jgi:hypothetical protein
VVLDLQVQDRDVGDEQHSLSLTMTYRTTVNGWSLCAVASILDWDSNIAINSSTSDRSLHEQTVNNH